MAEHPLRLIDMSSASRRAWHMKHSCTGKVRHDNWYNADVEVKRMAATHGETFRWYECEYCGGYHVCHAESSRSRKRARKRLKCQNQN